MIRTLAGLLALLTLTIALGGCVVVDRHGGGWMPGHWDGPVWVPGHYR